jgi:hypothetical protein
MNSTRNNNVLNETDMQVEGRGNLRIFDRHIFIQQ